MPGVGRQMRVLIVDDRPIFRAGANIRLAQGSFDLVVADLDVADSTGPATLDRLLQAGERPVIVLSSEPEALRARYGEGEALRLLQRLAGDGEGP